MSTSRLRTAALVVLVAAAIGSLVLTLRAGRNTPLFLLILFVGWILSPFVGLTWGIVVSKRWPALTQVTLYCVTLVIALVSLALYGELIERPAGSPPAFVFVLGPAASWLFIAIALSGAGLISRRRSQRLKP